MTIIKDEKSRDCESLQNSNGELATGDGIAVTYVRIGYPYIATMYVCYARTISEQVVPTIYRTTAIMQSLVDYLQGGSIIISVG